MRRIVIGLVLLALLLAAAVLALNLRDEDNVADAPAATSQATPEQIARGAYLARAGNCIGCHTARGGAAYAGGRGIDTPFGTVYSSNLTPDAQTGIGSWSAAHFWRALHNGRSKDGRLLYPAFPYPSYTRVTRDDADAIFAFLRGVRPVAQANRTHALRFPYDSQPALAVWRALFFEPGVHEPEAARSAQWNRGAYLVRGLGHCDACHSSRNIFGATTDSLELSGGLIPMQNWYAPSLASPAEAGVADWETREVVQLLKTGVSARGSVTGPMAEVVYRSTQHLSDADLAAMTEYLKALPPAQPPPTARQDVSADPEQMARGQKIYESRCADCHGAQGQGATGAYPPLAGNRAVTMASAANLVRIVLSGGFAPATAGNPRPYGMPPYSHELNDADVAAVLSTIRASWGNRAAPVSALDVLRYR